MPVAWISPPLHWSQWRSRKSSDSPPPSRMHPEMFILASADGLPAINAPAAVQRALLRRRVRLGSDWLRDHGCRSIELQVWSPQFADAIDWDAQTTSSYHIDDEYSWSTVDQAMSDKERRLIQRVDRVFVTSSKLLETKGGINPRTIFSPNGVDFDAFSSAAQEPDDLARIPRPRAGYVGVLKEQLDWELLRALATRNGAWSFVFVGPRRDVHESLRPALSAMARLPNVHFIGERNPGQLPGYLQHLDVSLLPYRLNAYTDAINPLKLYEGLASGAPLVSSRIRTVSEFADVVTCADGIDGWTASIAAAVSDLETSTARRAARQAVAREFDWDVIAQRLLPPRAPADGTQNDPR